MPVIALDKDYAKKVEFRDNVNNFHGNQLTYVHWEEHNMFCSAIAFPLPPAMPFGALVSEVIAPHYAAHPDAAKIDWSKVEWMIDGKKVTPDFDKSLAENGMKHKSLVRFWTPGLNGYKGTYS
ncbi:phenol hydroxylase subunit P4 [Pseudaquidulcibacter saccharophilus]|uniref:phenol hydroxylase subunit P4 n=1 Tax=Pseudaquidulcibacter saccharophilus TaxID=2831900 RepID=UPI001EFF5352|nr:phenol hydroxylase subunit P4 [Pseudaquidulcibacter saccharophilus]